MRQPYGDCDCPVGVQCKHCAALIQTFLSAVEVEQGAGTSPAVAASDKRVEQSWLRWLDELATLHRAFDASRVEPERRLGLLIDSEPGHPLPHLRVAAVWLRPSRSKAWARLVDPRAIQWNGSQLDPAPAEGWDPVVEEPLGLLLADARPERFGSGTAWSSLTRPWQARALQTLLEAPGGPTAFLARHTGPQLAPGPRRQLRVQWRSDADGVQHLQAELEGDHPLTDQCRLSMAGNELWYLDPEAGVMGPVEGSPALAVRAQQAPPIPEHKVAWAAEQMRRLAELPPGLDPPAAMETVELPRVAPGLVVTLGVIVLESRHPSMPDHEFGHASLAFEYGEVRFPQDATESDRVVRYGRVFSVSRDRKAEAALLDRLPAELVRLDALTKCAGLPPPREEPGARLLCLAEDLPASLDAWSGVIAAPEQWWALITELRAAGVRVELESDFPEEPERVEPDAWHGDIEPAGNGWFDLGLDVEVDGERLELLPLLRRALEDRDFPVEPDPGEPEDATCDLPLEDGRILVLPLARLRPLVRTVLDWVDDDPEAGSVRLPVTVVAELGPGREWRWRGRKHVQKLGKTLADLPPRLPQRRDSTARCGTIRPGEWPGCGAWPCSDSAASSRTTWGSARRSRFWHTSWTSGHA
ncbi:MAG: hypothetical protein U5R48_09165 [Gammaproteobacteria bacterium]|nr:hypothetical protein [Gammaproteobacteria bacterium]